MQLFFQGLNAGVGVVFQAIVVGRLTGRRRAFFFSETYRLGDFQQFASQRGDNASMIRQSAIIPLP
jgi:hypothetical protein